MAHWAHNLTETMFALFMMTVFLVGAYVGWHLKDEDIKQEEYKRKINDT